MKFTQQKWSRYVVVRRVSVRKFWLEFSGCYGRIVMRLRYAGVDVVCGQQIAGLFAADIFHGTGLKRGRVTLLRMANGLMCRCFSICIKHERLNISHFFWSQPNLLGIEHSHWLVLCVLYSLQPLRIAEVELRAVRTLSENMTNLISLDPSLNVKKQLV